MWCSGLRIWHCYHSGSAHCYGTSVGSLAKELSHATGMAKKQKQNKKKTERNISLKTNLKFLFIKFLFKPTLLYIS